MRRSRRRWSASIPARLDSLPAPSVRRCRGASVIGHVFWDQALAALDASAPAALPALDNAGSRCRAGRRGAGRPARVRLQPQDPARRHMTVLKRRRRALHLARCRLARRARARAADWMAAAAEHYALAGQAGRAAESSPWPPNAQSRYAHDAALGHASRSARVAGRGRRDTPAPPRPVRRAGALAAARGARVDAGVLGRRAATGARGDAGCRRRAGRRSRAVAARRSSQLGLHGRLRAPGSSGRGRWCLLRARGRCIAPEAQRLLADALGAQAGSTKAARWGSPGLPRRRTRPAPVEGVFTQRAVAHGGLETTESPAWRSTCRTCRSGANSATATARSSPSGTSARTGSGSGCLDDGSAATSKRRCVPRRRRASASRAARSQPGPPSPLGRRFDARSRPRPKRSSTRWPPVPRVRSRRVAHARRRPNCCSATTRPRRRRWRGPRNWPRRSAMAGGTTRWPVGRRRRDDERPAGALGRRDLALARRAAGGPGKRRRNPGPVVVPLGARGTG